MRAALYHFRRRRLRSALTVSAIAIAVFSVLLIALIAEAAGELLTQELEGVGVDGLLVSADAFTFPAPPLGEAQLSAVASVRGAKAGTPLLYSMRRVRIGAQGSGAMLVGVGSGSAQVLRLTPGHGRLLRESDLAERRHVCMVDIAAAKTLYARENVVGKTLYVELGGHEERFEIVGVVRSGGRLLQQMSAGMLPCLVYLPMTTLQGLDMQAGYTQLAVEPKSGVSAKVLRERLTEALVQSAPGVSAESYRIEDIAAQRASLERIARIAFDALSAVALVSLVVSGLGIMSTMLIAVQERRREIGIKMALGASRFQVMVEFLTEAALLAAGSTLLGAALASGAFLLAVGAFSLSVTPDLRALALRTLLTGGVCVLFGAYPAYLASRILPARAIRGEE